MSYSPAAMLSVFSHNREHLQERVAALASHCGANFAWEDQVFSSRASGVDTLESVHVAVSIPKGPLSDYRIQAWVFIKRSNGEHENVCLEEEREFFLGLLHLKLIDVVEFCYGLPIRNGGFFKSKYEIGSIHGTGSYVSLYLLLRDIPTRKRELVAPPLHRFLQESQEELSADHDLVEVDLTPQTLSILVEEATKFSKFHDLCKAVGVRT